MSRVTIEMPTGLCGENGRSAAGSAGAANAGATEQLHSDGVDESVRTFVRWVGCWAE